MAADKPRIGWIGTGIMGEPMCRHLIEAGYQATVFTRTQSKARELLNQGAQWADSPAQVAQNADIVFTLVSYPEDVRQVILSANGVFETLSPGSILVDMTTSSPSLAVEIYEKARKKEMQAIDAPVSGGYTGAQNAVLSVMAGGDREAFQAVLPLFECMGKAITYTGAAGTGQHTKMCNQIQIAGTMIGVVECLLYGYKAGLDLEMIIAATGQGAAGSWSINNLGPKIIQRDFSAGFFIEYFLKDMAIALDEAGQMNLSLPGLSLVHQFYTAAQAFDWGKSGIQALALVLERLNNMKIEIKT